MTLKTAFKKSASFVVTNTTDNGFTIGIRNTDRHLYISNDTPLNEVLDFIWGEGVERGKKKIKDFAKGDDRL